MSFRFVCDLLHTVSPTHSRSIAQLWYVLGVLWLGIIYLKSAIKCFLSVYPNKHRPDLFKKLVFDPVGQTASKFEDLKVCSNRDSNPGRPKTKSFNKVSFWPCRPNGLKIWGPQSLQRPGFEPGSPEDQIYNSDFAKNVASNPKCLNIFLIANFASL